MGGVAFLHKDILQGTATPYTILNNLCQIALATQTIMFLLISCVRNVLSALWFQLLLLGKLAKGTQAEEHPYSEGGYLEERREAGSHIQSFHGLSCDHIVESNGTHFLRLAPYFSLGKR